MSDLILGIDAGNYQAKVAGPYGVDYYRTAICEWFERNLVESFGDDDMEFEVYGRRGFAGTIAEYEDVFGGSSMYGGSKAHEDTLIRVLLAIFRYCEKYCLDIETISVVVGQPVVSHTSDEKRKIQEMLLGCHEFTVNGMKKVFQIENVGVAAEGTAAYWCQDHVKDSIRIIDVGSGTVNAATITNSKAINTNSGTFNFGVETVDIGMESLARGIIRETTKLRWMKTDQVLLCGGAAEKILPHLQDHYNDTKLFRPTIETIDGLQVLDSVYSNAVGFYTIGKGVFS